MGVSYKDSGVDIVKGDEFVDIIKAISPQKSSKKIGLFGAVLDVKEYGFSDPLIVTGTDGVGTKLHLAKLLGRHDTIGIDLVAMCVNDVLCHGAKPLFFLDYYATGKLELDVSTEIIKGILRGCEFAGCELVGGETAEMPILYRENDYDLAGFVIAAVERADAMPRLNDVKHGDVIVGLPSSGVHSNGYSLVNKLIHDGKLALDAEFLEPTKIYVKEVLGFLQQFGRNIKAMAHITGGGLYDNIMRVVPNDFDAAIDFNSFTRPDVFNKIQIAGKVDELEMRKVYNLGIGFTLITDAKTATQIPNSKIIGHINKKNS